MHHTWISALIVRFPARVLKRPGFPARVLERPGPEVCVMRGTPEVLELF